MQQQSTHRRLGEAAFSYKEIQSWGLKERGLIKSSRGVELLVRGNGMRVAEGPETLGQMGRGGENGRRGGKER